MEEASLVFINSAGDDGKWYIVQGGELHLLSIIYPVMHKALEGFDNVRVTEDGNSEEFRRARTGKWEDANVVFKGLEDTLEDDVSGNPPSADGTPSKPGPWWKDEFGSWLKLNQYEDGPLYILDVDKVTKFAALYDPELNQVDSFTEAILRAHEAGDTEEVRRLQALKDPPGAPSQAKQTSDEIWAIIDADPKMQALNYRPEQMTNGLWIAQPGPAPKPAEIARSIEELIVEKLAKGDIQGAQRLRAFQNAPSQLDLFNLALTAVQSPAEFFLLDALLQQGGGIASSFKVARSASLFGLDAASPFRLNGQAVDLAQAAAAGNLPVFPTATGPGGVPTVGGLPTTVSEGSLPTSGQPVGTPPKPPNIAKLKAKILQDIEAAGGSSDWGLDIEGDPNFDLDQFVVDSVQAKVSEFKQAVAAYNKAKTIKTPTQKAADFAGNLQQQIEAGAIDYTDPNTPYIVPVGTQHMIDVEAGKDVPKGFTFPDLGGGVPTFASESQALTETTFERDLRGNLAELAGVPRGEFHAQEQRSFGRLGSNVSPFGTTRLGQRKRVGV